MTKTTIQGQEDIFSMFGIVDEYAEQKKKEEEERKKKQEELRKKAQEAASKSLSTANKASKVEPETFDVTEDTIIRYFGESIEICTYFTTEELAEGLLINKKDGETERKKIDGEMLRKRMEKDFPELVKDMTEMKFIKTKNIVVPVMKAKKKGNCCKETSSDLSEDVSSHSALIPFSILKDFISIARFFNESLLEVHGDIYFNSETKKFYLDIPKQTVHKYWCEVKEDAQEIAEKMGGVLDKVLEIHSHHRMAPTPSWQDNASEIIPGMLYVIVGRLDRPFPEITIRRFISEQAGYQYLSYDKIFEDPFYRLPEFNLENIEVAI